jgi:hypothetical protein
LQEDLEERQPATARELTMFMGRDERETPGRFNAEIGLSSEDLCDVETYFWSKGSSEFVYDEELDVFRFPQDGRFAFCKEFADWELLQERRYLEF